MKMSHNKNTTPPSTHKKSTDNTLMRQMCEGKEDAAIALYERYASRLLGFVKSRCSTTKRRLDAEDIVQSVFRRFFTKVKKQPYHVPDGEELWSLFVVIALNRIRSEESYQRAQKRDINRTCATADGRPLEEQPSLEDSASRLLPLTIAEALETLPQQQRSMVELRMDGHEIADIAQKVGRSKRSVERGLQQVRQRLQSLFDRFES